jgi:hypothetical protein
MITSETRKNPSTCPDETGATEETAATDETGATEKTEEARETRDTEAEDADEIIA